MFENRHRGANLRTLLTILITSLAVGTLVFILTSGYISRNSAPPEISPEQRNTQVPKPQQISADSVQGNAVSGVSVARSAAPGVVGISVLKIDGASIFDRNAAEKWGIGSGVILSSNGYILTNNHVAGGRNKRIVVSLADGRNIDGMTVWADPVLDLAIVKINADGLTTVPIGDANSLQVGEPAIAIGNPLGLQFQRSVTSGIISALNRTISIDTPQGTNYMEDLIQTDASINPGNSGGPLLNSKGQVVGINTIKVTSAEGLGFAIPINVAVPIIRQLAEKGEFSEPYLGVFAYDKEIIPYLDSSLKLDSGIYIANVDEKGPAFKSGVRVGCIITHVDGVAMNTMMQLRTYIYAKKPGDIIRVNHISGGKSMVLKIKLAAKEQDWLLTR